MRKLAILSALLIAVAVAFADAPVVKLSIPEYRNNFYPGQNSDVVRGKVVADGAVEVEISGPGFKSQKRKAAPDGSFEFDTRGFAYGDAFVVAKSASGESRVRVRRLPPVDIPTSWIEHGRLVVNGKPVVRRNMYAHGYLGGRDFKEKFERDMVHMTKDIVGIGSLEAERLVPGSEKREAVRDCAPSAEVLAAIDKVIEKGLAGKGVYYYISDEPECRKISPVYLRHVYEYVSERDPYHVILSCSRSGERYMDCLDWIEPHPYMNPYYDCDGVRRYGRSLKGICDSIDECHPDAHPDKCVGHTPGAFAYPGGDYPTIEEFVASVWCGFMHGAKTLYPYAYHEFGSSFGTYYGVQHAFAAAKALEPFLLNGKRTRLARTDEYEAVSWRLPDGKKMFAVVNFTDKKVNAVLEGMREPYIGFLRPGARFAPIGSRGLVEVALGPYETVVATTVKCDRDIAEYSIPALKARFLKAWTAPLHGDNQLVGRRADIVFSSSTQCNCLVPERALFDGVRDVTAWYHNWSANPFVEMAFGNKSAVFSKVRIYGHWSDSASPVVSVRKDRKWIELEPSSVATNKSMTELSFGRVVSTPKVRVSFRHRKPDAKISYVELYEIELPKAAGAKQARRPAAPPPAVREDVLWRLDGGDAKVGDKSSRDAWFGFDGDISVDRRPDGGFTLSGMASHQVEVDPGYRWIVFEFDRFETIVHGKYLKWSMHLTSPGGSLAGTVTKPQKGLYTVPVPKVDKRKSSYLRLYDYNFKLGLKYIQCVKEPATCLSLTADGEKDEVSAGDTIHIRLRLARPCEDVSCSILVDREKGKGMQPFPVNGVETVDLERLTPDGRTWGADIKLEKFGTAPVRKVILKAVTLGGGLGVPIFTTSPFAFAGQ